MFVVEPSETEIGKSVDFTIFNIEAVQWMVAFITNFFLFLAVLERENLKARRRSLRLSPRKT